MRDRINKVDSCTNEQVTLAVPPNWEAPAKAAIQDIYDGCPGIALQVKSSAEVVQAEDVMLPDLWIADSPTALAATEQQGMKTKVLKKTLASSPIVLAGGPTAKQPESWSEALTSGQMTLNAPEVDGASAVALTAAAAENPELDATEMSASFIGIAQSYGEAKTSGGSAEHPLSDIKATSNILVPATEQESIVERRKNDNIKPVVPKTGPLKLNFPLVAFDTDKSATEAGGKFAEWFQTKEGKGVLEEAHLRVPSGAPLENGALTRAEALPAIPPTVLGRALNYWRVVTVPSNLLVLVDVSGSMSFSTPDNLTRLQLEASAAKVALESFPSNARIGLWAFSTPQDELSKSKWRVLAPHRRLGADVKGQTHNALLTEKLAQLGGLVGGGTPLHAVVDAGYKKAIQEYNPNYFNALVVMTDGSNDDPQVPDLAPVLKELKRQQNQDRNIRMITIGIGPDADMETLTKMAKATGGAAYQANTAQDMLKVFSDALLNR